MQRQLLRLFLVATVLVPALVGAVAETDFEVKTTQQLLTLCTAPPNDPRYREALHFCHGYLLGAYHYHVASTDGEGGKPLVCFPTPPPSRNEAISMFIAWAQAHPQYMNERPVETEFRFLIEKWPCQKLTTRHVKERTMKKLMTLTVILILVVGLSGCTGMSQTEQSTLSGGAMGAAGGALIGAMAGNAGMGAAIGAGVGLAGGYLYGKHKESEQKAYQQGYQQGQQSR